MPSRTGAFAFRTLAREIILAVRLAPVVLLNRDSNPAAVLLKPPVFNSKEFPPPAPSLWSLPQGERLRKAAIPSAALRTSFYPGCGTPRFPLAHMTVFFPHPARPPSRETRPSMRAPLGQRRFAWSAATTAPSLE